MIDESCEVPREDLDEGFNPCRRQVVENGELRQYAHMYDVMNERYDREEDTSYLNSVKRDKITSTTPVLLAGNNTQIYANSTNGEGRVNMLPSSAFNNPSNHTEASIPSAKAVADYVAANIPDVSSLEAEIDGKLNKVTSTGSIRSYAVDANGNQIMRNINGDYLNIATGHIDIPTAGAVADYVTANIPDISALEAEIEGKLDKYEDASGHDKLYAVGPTGTQYMCILAKTIPESGYDGNPFTVGAVKDYAPIPLPVSKGGTGAQTAQGALTNLLPHTTSEEPATGALVYDVDSGSTYLRAISGEPNGNQTDLVDRAGIQAMIDTAVANLATKSDLENYVQKSTETSAHGQVYAVTKDGEQAMEDIVVHLVES